MNTARNIGIPSHWANERASPGTVSQIKVVLSKTFLASINYSFIRSGYYALCVSSIAYAKETLVLRAFIHIVRKRTIMCFSANASFAGAVVISAIGVATVREVHKPSQMVFASIPLFFGLQQFTEGLLWLTLRNPQLAHIETFCTYMFLVMAEVLWPMMIPLSVLFMEKSKKRKKILWVLLAMGISASLYYTFCLLFFNVTPQIMGYHIQYKNDFPNSWTMIAFITYFIASVTPLFVSSTKRTHLLGILMSLSFLVTAVFYWQYLASVWCFFAALMSGVIFWILRDAKKKFNFDKLHALENEVKAIVG